MTSHLTLPRLWAAAALACVFFAVSFTWVYPADFWWHLRLGEDILSGGSIPTTDSYSFTARGQPFLYQGWLSGVLFALAYRMGGVPLIVLLNALSFTLAYGLLLSLCRWMAGGSLRLAAAATFGAFLLGIENWAVRPQTFSVLLFALTWWLLWRYTLGRGGVRSLALLPLLTGLWANLHGAFPLALALQALFLLGLLLQRARWLPLRRLRDVPLLPLLASAFASGLATMATPYGPKLYSYLLTILTNPSISTFIVEWQRPTLDSAPGKVFYLAVLAVALVILLSSRRPAYRTCLPDRQAGRPDAPSLLALLALGWLGAGALRNVIWFGFAAAPVVAALAPGVADRLKDSTQGAGSPRSVASEEHPQVSGRLSLVVAGFLLLLVVAALPWVRPLLPLPPDRQSLLAPDTPVATTEALLRSMPARVFADMQYSSYLLWRMPGAGHLFIDPRIELYPYDLWVEYGTISHGSETQLLEKYGVEALLVSKERQGGLLRWVAHQPGWRLMFEDGHSSVWVRQ